MSSEVIDMTGDSDDDCIMEIPPPSKSTCPATVTSKLTSTSSRKSSASANPKINRNHTDTNMSSNKNNNNSKEDMHCWKVVLLMDHREFNRTGLLEVVQERINEHFQRKSNNCVYHSYCEMQALPSADYMFVARKYSGNPGRNANVTMVEERVFDTIVERKNVEDLSQCLIKPSKKYKPLSFFEAQMYKLQHCELPNKLFLLEGDEDCPKQFSHHKGNEKELDKMKKRVKTLRMQIQNGEYRGIDIISTRSKGHTVRFLIDQMEKLQRQFDRSSIPPALTMQQFKSTIDRNMKAPTFLEYLRLRSMKGIGDKKAMKVIMDPEKNWDKNFVSPACTSKTTKSTLEDKATFYVPVNCAAAVAMNQNDFGDSDATRGHKRRNYTTSSTNRSAAGERKADSVASSTSKPASSSNASSGGRSNGKRKRSSPDTVASDPKKSSSNSSSSGNPRSSGEKNISTSRQSPGRSQIDGRSSVFINHPLPMLSYREIVAGYTELFNHPPNSVSATLYSNGDDSSRVHKKKPTASRRSEPKTQTSKSSRLTPSSSTSPIPRQKSKATKKTSPHSSLSPNQPPTLESSNKNERVRSHESRIDMNSVAKRSSWTCTRCTFVNENLNFLVCEMCHAER